MLRRKMIIHLGLLVLLLLLTTVLAIVLLQNVLSDLNHVNETGWSAVEDVNELSITINEIELDLYELKVGRAKHLDKLIESVEQARRLLDRIGQYYMTREPQALPLLSMLQQSLPIFERDVGALATARDERVLTRHQEAALNAAVAMRHHTLPLSRYVRDHANSEQQAISSWFRWIVLGLALVFLLVINVSVVWLLRMGASILRPLDQLVEASRELARDRLDYRVKVEQDDEFGELGHSFNSLAEQLQANEKRKMETLQQVARAMNHELNNAMAIIELQMQMLSRRSTGSPATDKYLREIRASLERMTNAVQSLKNIRRIVLTEYVPGTKMLDLQRSSEVDTSDQNEHVAGPV